MADIYSEIATAGTSYEIYTDLNRFSKVLNTEIKKKNL